MVHHIKQIRTRFLKARSDLFALLRLENHSPSEWFKRRFLSMRQLSKMSADPTFAADRAYQRDVTRVLVIKGFIRLYPPRLRRGGYLFAVEERKKKKHESAGGHKNFLKEVMA